MQRFVLEQSSRETHTSRAGLALLGRAIRLSDLEAAVDEIPLLHGIAHRDVIKSYLGLLALGKSDFEAVSNMRADPFFRQALDIARVPSAARLRLRLDQHAEALMERAVFVKTVAASGLGHVREAAAFLGRVEPDLAVRVPVS